MEHIHQPGEVIAKRYQIFDILGQGGIAIAYRAQDLNSDRQVALKALSLNRMQDWKALELFEREARILKGLNHPQIPDYLDYFSIETENNCAFYLVQQLAPGKSLAAWIESGWQPNETEVQAIAIQILEILVYLQTLTPPVIHRDIKPQNILLYDPQLQSDRSSSQKQIFLVDFGSVQDTYRHTVTRGSTVVGTYGYMAPEQFRGQAQLATDLYGLATTLLFLLTRQPPENLPQRQLKYQFRARIRVSKRFANWLDIALEPAVEDRFTSAQQALEALQACSRSDSGSIRGFRKPQIIAIKTGDRLSIELPPKLLYGDFSIRKKILKELGISNLLLGGILLVLCLNWLFSYFSSWFLNFAIVGLAIFLLFNLLPFLTRSRLSIDLTTFSLESWLLDWCYWKVQHPRAKMHKFLSLSDLTPDLRKRNLLDRLFARFKKTEAIVYDFGEFLTIADRLFIQQTIETHFPPAPSNRTGSQR